MLFEPPKSQLYGGYSRRHTGRAPLRSTAARSRPQLQHPLSEGGASHVPALRMEIVKSSDDVKGLVVLPRRCAVERTFSWFGRNRHSPRITKTLPTLSPPSSPSTSASSASLEHGLFLTFESDSNRLTHNDEFSDDGQTSQKSRRARKGGNDWNQRTTFCGLFLFLQSWLGFFLRLLPLNGALLCTVFPASPFLPLPHDHQQHLSCA